MFKNEMKEFLAKNKAGLLIVGYLAILAGLFYFFEQPIISRISAVSDEIQQKNIDGDIEKDKISKLADAEKTHQLIVDKKDELSIIMDRSQEVDFIKTLETLASESGSSIILNVEEDRTDPTAKNKKPIDKGDIRVGLPSDNYLLLQINLQGSYLSLVNFMNKLENYKYYINIVSVKIDKNVNSTSTSNPFSVANGGKNINIKGQLNSSIEAVIYTK